MRVVFVNRIAWPDEGATALYLTDVAEATAAAGHEVHVVCGEAPYRPGGDGSARPPTVHGGVRYHRLPGRRGRGLLDRAFASVSFHARVAGRLARIRRPDVVVALTDPPFVDVVASAVARRRGAAVVHWLMDVYPDVVFAAGVLPRGSLAGRALAFVMGAAWRRAALVVVLGDRVRGPVVARGVNPARVRTIENWAPAGIEEAAGAAAPRPERPVTLMYSGNYGVAHDLSPLVERLRASPHAASLRLVVQASGSRVAELRAALSGLATPVVWRDPVPGSRLADSLREGDVHVACVRAGFEDLVVPSKVYAPRALGLPVLWVGARRPASDALPDSAPRGSVTDVVAGLVGAGVTLVEASPRPRAQGIAEWVAAVEGVASSRSRGSRVGASRHEVTRRQPEGA